MLSFSLSVPFVSLSLPLAPHFLSFKSFSLIYQFWGPCSSVYSQCHNAHSVDAAEKPAKRALWWRWLSSVIKKAEQDTAGGSPSEDLAEVILRYLLQIDEGPAERYLTASNIQQMSEGETRQQSGSLVSALPQKLLDPQYLAALCKRSTCALATRFKPPHTAPSLMQAQEYR